MPYDVVVIGAGLAGLVAALRSARGGARVLVLARGVGSTQLSGGTIDVLGYAPERVGDVGSALPAFVAAHPDHPYAHMDASTMTAAVDWFKACHDGPALVGDLDRNYLLPTALGAVKPAAVVPQSMASGDLTGGGRFLIAGLKGLKDFYPALLADNLQRARLPAGPAVHASPVEIAAPGDGEADVVPHAWARRFEDAAFREAIVTELARSLDGADAVGLPAVLGLDEAPTVWRDMQSLLGLPIFEIPTLPPSVPGMRTYRSLRRALARAGGRVIVGNPVVGANTSGGRVQAVVAEAAGRSRSYRAQSFILATGGIASGGIAVDSYRQAREAVFDLPVTGVPAAGERHFDADYFASHPIGRAGIRVDDELRPVTEAGEPAFDNLRACGAVLAGAEPWKEKSGDGISLTTGFCAAESIATEG